MTLLSLEVDFELRTLGDYVLAMQIFPRVILRLTLILGAAALIAFSLASKPSGVGGIETAAARDWSDSPVLVELYTSQGCSSCPPADAFLGELAMWPGVIALAFHVDYWDYIGWKDPFANPAYTQRQKSYQRSLDSAYVYTPQMIIDGWTDAVGSRRGEVERKIAKARERKKAVEVTFDSTDGGRVAIPAGQAPEGGADVWLAVYDKEHETEIGRGENSGRTLKDFNVVRELQHLGYWNGEAMTIPLQLDAAAERGRAGCAVIVQHRDTKAVLGAGLMRVEELAQF